MKDVLTFCRPEEVGIDPKLISGFINRINTNRLMCHSFILMRGEKVAAEGYWKPFSSTTLHRMYSVSKSFASAAIGLLVDQGKISLDDKIIDYFPEYINGEVDPLLERTTVRHLLMMATPYSTPMTYTFEDDNWISTFFNPHVAADHEPGSRWNYDTSASHTLGVLVQKISGKPFLEFLKDECLREAGFSEQSWCVCAPEGYSWAGSGVMCTTRDLARFATLFLRGTKLGGKSVWSDEYRLAATSKQISNGEPCGNGKVSGFGYGYQVWQLADGAFGFVGMGGQLAIYHKETDILFVCNSDLQGVEAELDQIAVPLYEEILEKVCGSTLQNDESYYEMKALCEGLSCAIPFGSTDIKDFSKIDKSAFCLEKNPMGIEKIAFKIENSRLCFDYIRDGKQKQILFGIGEYSVSTFPETHYYGSAVRHPQGRGYKCISTAVIPQPDTLLLRVYSIEHNIGNVYMKFNFSGDGVQVQMDKYAEAFFDEYKGTAFGKRI